MSNVKKYRIHLLTSGYKPIATMYETLDSVRKELKKGGYKVTSETILDLSLIHISEPTRPY